MNLICGIVFIINALMIVSHKQFCFRCNNFCKSQFLSKREEMQQCERFLIFTKTEKMKKLTFKVMMFLTGLMIVATSCDKTDDPAKAGKGTIVLKLTDAPFPVSLVDKAMVTIDKIEIRSENSVSGESSDDDSVYTVLYEGDGKVFNLLDLQNGVTEEVLSMPVDTGFYDLIRLHVVGAEIVLKSGDSFDLKVPSGNSSGLKIKISPELEIESGVESEVLLDFDVSKSFVVQGNLNTPAGIKGFIFKPVLRAMCQKYSGSIEGTVSENETTPIPEANIQIMLADTIYSSAQSDENGKYRFVGLPAGTYKLTCEKEDYTTVEVDPVVVMAKEKTVQDIVMTKP